MKELQKLKTRLLVLFGIIVIISQLLVGSGIILFEFITGRLTYDLIMQSYLVLGVEILILSVFTFLSGYYFVKKALAPTTDMLNRLEQFIQDASHELKTPLGLIQSSIELAQRSGNYDKHLDKALQSLQGSKHLINKLLELARLDKLSLYLERCDVVITIEQALAQYELSIKEKNITITKDLPESYVVRADAKLLELTIDNLIANAIKYNIQQGAIWITIKDNSCTIRNTGELIPDDKLPLIFDRFYQASESRSEQGYGIGLALVKRISDLHSWNIQAVSNKEYSEFRLQFR
jgi:signal transduction histidine kinase